MFYKCDSDGCTYETKKETLRRESQVFIRCLNGITKPDKWVATTQEHVDRMVRFEVFKEAENETEQRATAQA